MLNKFIGHPPYQPLTKDWKSYLHAAVINNDVFVFNLGVKFSHLRTALQEETIRELPVEINSIQGELSQCSKILKLYGQNNPVTHLHNVCLVDSGHFAAALLGGIVKCKFSDAPRFLPGDDL